MSNPVVKENSRDWIGVDFDGVLVEYHGFQGAGIFGAPILPMIERVKIWINQGKDVRIFTSRVGPAYPKGVRLNRVAIEDFCIVHFGKKLPVTCVKDQHCREMWDDRAVQMIPNTGYAICAPMMQLEQAKPVILYFTNDADRDEFIEMVQAAKPEMKSFKL